MRQIKIKRLWHGYASVRDYLIEEAKKENQGIEIVMEEESMEIPYSKIDELKTQKTKDVFYSKHDSRAYKLIDFEWKPTHSQQKLL